MNKFAVMLAHPYKQSKFPVGGIPMIEPKLDGVRVVIHASPTGIRYYSRNGRRLEMFSPLDDEIELLSHVIQTRCRWLRDGVFFDGEMMSKTFNEMAGTVHRKDFQAHDVKFHCFHAMPLDYFFEGKDVTSQFSRLEALDEVRFSKWDKVEFGTPEVVRSHDQVLDIYTAHRNAGFEGSMLKDMSQPWIAKRSYAWLKLKDELSVDVPVVGVEEGEGKYAGTCGTLVVDYNGVQVPVSGMTDAQRHEFWAAPDKVIGRIVEVSYQQETCHGSLRHPRFKRFRDDKA